MEKIFGGINCPKCGSKMNVQMISVTKKRSIAAMLGYLFLAMITCGLALFLFARGRGDKVEAFAVCPNCGYRERLRKNGKR